MPRNRSAIAALQKLEAYREALDAKQRELEAQAAKELGQIILGTGLETFSKKGLKQVAEALGKLGETAAIAKLAERLIRLRLQHVVHEHAAVLAAGEQRARVWREVEADPLVGGAAALEGGEGRLGAAHVVAQDRIVLPRAAEEVRPVVRVDNVPVRI